MWLCDVCGAGSWGDYVKSRDDLHEHMSIEAHFLGWIWHTETIIDGETTVRVEVVRTSEGDYYFKHEPFPEPGRHGN